MRRLFLITLQHRFYDDGLWSSARLSADDRTNALFRRCELLQKQSKVGLGVYYYGARDPVRYVSMLSMLGDSSFGFNLFCNDPYWMNISALPISWSGQLNFTPPSSTSDKTITMSMSLTNRDVSENNVIGQVFVHPENLLDGAGAPCEPHYHIEMQTRKTQWRYYVCSRSSRQFARLSVKNREGISFEPPVEVTLPNGEPSQMFSSGARVFPLTQSIQKPFDLFEEGDNPSSEHMLTDTMSKPVIKALPIPRADTLGIDKEGPSTIVYSPMYVKI